MADALDMPMSERKARHTRFLGIVTRWSARDWLNAQLGDLGVVSPGTPRGSARRRAPT
jgi:trehalose-6-phosphate synthase